MSAVIRLLEGLLSAVVLALAGCLFASWLAADYYRAVVVFVTFAILAVWTATGAISDAFEVD